MRVVKDFVRSQPALYDQIRSLKRNILGAKSPAFEVLNEFSRSHNRIVNFVQIGANDGLRNDPVRPFVVRDRWHGVLVEPVPTTFALLKQNYAYLKHDGLTFANAAIATENNSRMASPEFSTQEPAADATAASSETPPSLNLWSYQETFLSAQTLEDRLGYLRKASFDREHVASFLPPGANPDQTLQSTKVPCRTLKSIIEKDLPRSPLHLLVIDVEGYEATLIPSINFSTLPIEALFFESEHLGPDQPKVFNHLRNAGFHLHQVALDTFATR